MTTAKMKTVLLGDACDVLDNLRKPVTKSDRVSGPYPYYGATGILDYVNNYIFDERTVLVGEDGAKWGTGESTAFIVEEQYWVNNHAHVIRPKKEILNDKWLVYFLNFSDLEKYITGVTVPKLNQKKLRGIVIPQPNIEKQRRIVKRLDEAFEKIDKAKKNTEKNLKNTQELYENILNQEIKNLPDEQVINSSIGQVCDLATGGTPSKNKPGYFVNGNIKWLVSGDIHKGEIYNCEGHITEKGLQNSNAKYLPLNSVLIALNGQGKTRGTVAILRTKATCNQSLVSIYPKNINELLPEYIFQNLKGRYQEIRKMTGDTGNERRGLNMKLIANTQFKYPKSIEKQKQSIEKLNSSFEKTQKLQKLYQQKLVNLEELKQSLLKQAFSGKL